MASLYFNSLLNNAPAPLLRSLRRRRHLPATWDMVYHCASLYTRFCTSHLLRLRTAILTAWRTQRSRGAAILSVSSHVFSAACETTCCANRRALRAPPRPDMAMYLVNTTRIWILRLDSRNIHVCQDKHAAHRMACRLGGAADALKHLHYRFALSRRILRSHTHCSAACSALPYWALAFMVTALQLCRCRLPITTCPFTTVTTYLP